MGKYRDLMDRDLRIRGFTDNTRRAYLGCVRRFVDFVGRPIPSLSIEDVHRWLLHLVRDRHVAWQTSNQATLALRFFFGTTLKKPCDIKEIPYRKTGRKLPVILSPSEVASLFEATPNLKHRALLMTVYSTGLRATEATRLRPDDLDRSRGCIHVHQGKGRKDRLVMLSPHLLEILDRYMAADRPSTWLFPGRDPARPLTRESLYHICKRARRRAGLRKPVSPHALRHAFATHLLENGINIRVIQLLLGHRSLRTTEVYTHVAQTIYAQTPSPLDRLMAEPVAQP